MFKCFFCHPKWPASYPCAKKTGVIQAFTLIRAYAERERSGALVKPACGLGYFASIKIVISSQRSPPTFQNQNNTYFALLLRSRLTCRVFRLKLGNTPSENYKQFYEQSNYLIIR